jgi:hypothetical protein
LTVTLPAVKEISIKINDDLYHRASRKLENLEAKVNQRVTEYLESVNGDEDIVAARTRMANLFATTKAFDVGVRPSREEMHERGSVR